MEFLILYFVVCPILLALYLLFSNPGKRPDPLSKGHNSTKRGDKTLFNASVKSADYNVRDVFETLKDEEPNFLGGSDDKKS